ncbi:porin family protein [Flavobacterium sp.]|uniref:porin family protein n=1 Tax=Flavobacterium sp. TaxID=239 RepID=UPI002FDB5698
MKKIILTIAVVMAATFANAQDKKGGSSSDMKFGVKAGYTNSTFTGDTPSGLKANGGFYIGGLVDFSVSETFHVQPELLYSIEGAKDNKLNYLRIPIMAKYYIMEGLNLQAGPELAFKAGGDDIKDQAKSLDYGLGIGAAYELESGLMFDARYNLGLANIDDSGSGGNVKNVSFNIGLGYRF